MRTSLFPGEVDREWLAYLSEFPPLPYVLAQHICAEALDEYQGRACQVVYHVQVPGWVLQWVHGDPWDEWAGDATLEDVFGDDYDAIPIDYCPFCPGPLPAVDADDTCVGYWHRGPAVTLRAVARRLDAEEEP